MADRWHLLNNLHEAVMREADHHHDEIRKAAEAASDDLASRAKDEEPAMTQAPAPSPPSRALTRAEQRKQANRARRLRRYEQVMALHEQGQSVRGIARQLRMNRKTVDRFVRAGRFPERAERRSHSRVDPFVDYLQQRWREGCTNAATLFEELKRKGFGGSYDTGRRKVAGWRDPSQRTRTSGPKPKQRELKIRRPSSRRVGWLLMKDHAELDEEERSLRRQIRHHCPQLRRAGSLAHWFRRLVKARRADRLEVWLTLARDAQGLPALGRFAAGLRDDLSAVKAAMNLPWSNGQVEGQINRLKLIKRQMYGRANFDLLRVRFLNAG